VKKIVSFAASLLLLSGCATARPVTSAVQPLAPSLSNFASAHRVSVGGQRYLPLEALAKQLKGHQLWDSETQIWSLAAGNRELRAAANIPLVLVNGSAHTLKHPPLLQEGRFLLPEEVWAQWLAGWTTAPAVPRRVPIKRLRTIVVDAGHGGKDPGAVSRGGLYEKTVTLDIARRLRDLLTREGFRVVMTRYDDRFVSLRQRSAIANREAGDLFISVHVNASRSRGVSGFEAYYLSEATDDNARALAAAENASLPDEVGEAVPSETEAIIWDLLYTEHRAASTILADRVCQGLVRKGLPVRNRGVKSARFAVLKGARMPAVLVEVGFISHRSEEARLRKPSYRRQLAEGIRNGIVKFRDDLERQYAAAP